MEILKEKKYLLKIYLIYINSFPKIDGFVEPSSQIDGFGQTHRTRANGATATRMNVNSFQDRENAQALPSNRPSIAKQ